MQRSIVFDRLQQSDTQILSLGQYRLLDELGRGGMGRVYKALHTIMGREVALKVISPELVSDPVAVEWFLREVRASTQLNHPNIVMAYDANEADGLYFLVMEYVHGRTLDALVKKQGPLPIVYACALMRQAALGLQHAHEKGMVHRDIKPGNLIVPIPPTPTLPYKGGGSTETPSPLVGEGGGGGADVLVKILDFGLARLHGKSKDDTIALRGEAGVLGTPDYIAPEQSRDIHAADIRSDLYSLGCVFYFTLTGYVPFPGDNAMEKLIKHLMEQPEPLERARPDVPPELAAIVRRLMAKDPADRYQTPAELARELEQFPTDTIRGATVRERHPDRSHSVAAHIDAEPQTLHTCVVNNVNVFALSRDRAELSGPSLSESLWGEGQDEQHRLETRDTLNLSRPQDTEEVTAEALADGIIPPAAPTSRRLDSDTTFQEMAIPDGTGVPPSGTLPAIDPVIFRLWRRWLGFLETIIVGRGPSRVNSGAYRTIHSLLLQACRGAIDACPAPERRTFYEECLSIAQPWLKLQTFALADAAMLHCLLRRCRQIEVELNNGKAPWTIRQVLALVLLTLSPAGGALWYWYYGRFRLPSLFKLFDGDFSVSTLHTAWRFLQTHPALLMGVFFPLVIIFSVVLLSRTPRA
ncbi:MAG TPA: serine/threonine-protein kinase [Gemmataceae bacterium]